MDRTTLFVDVILPLPVKGLFTYRVPVLLNVEVEKGKRVVVQFGKKKIYTALIHTIHKTPPKKYFAKYILSVLDEDPVVNDMQFTFWKWLSDYYMANLGDVMNASLPSGLKLESETKVVLNPDFDHDYSKLNEKEHLVAEAVEIQKELTLSLIADIVEQVKVIPLVKTLIEKKVVILKEELKEHYKPKIETFVTLTSEYEVEEKMHGLFDKLQKKAPKQLELLMSFLNLTMKEKAKEITRPELLKTIDSGNAPLNALVKKGVFALHQQKVSRLQDFESFSDPDFITLTDHQKNAFKNIREHFFENDIALLHGITSSGKTEIYIKLINEYIKTGKQVLYLLPEIALTTQIINRLRKYFGDRIGVYHSKYNEYERVEIWNRVLEFKNDASDEPKYQIILGARSAIFLPFTNLGLIIVDEEHDTSYKQFDPAPRYNARDSALFLARQFGAKTLLGSATPSVESYYNASTSKYGLFELTERYGGIQLPEIEVVDIKLESRRNRMRSVFSPQLLERITQALQNKEQVILFQNRRGFSLRLECEVCNWMPQCKRCDVTLIYHKKSNHLRCHYCGYTEKVPGVCPECKSTSIKMQGFGTEKVEEELATILPDARITRMDLDTTRSRKALQRIIQDFEDRKIDILVGTQMVTKGLDFDNVKVVSILNADNMLNFPDFRSFERGFQLMAQVSGRAGRKNKRGIVIIQTYNPKHIIIQNVIDNDYLAMYQTQVLERINFKYPPYYRLILLKLKHKDFSVLNKSARLLADQLRMAFPQRVLGPEYPMVSRINNYYIKHILIKTERKKSISGVKTGIEKQIEKFYENTDNKGVRIVIDVDPV